jgi:hypothetical protein
MNLDTRLVPEMILASASMYVLFRFFSGAAAQIGGRHIPQWPIHGREWLAGPQRHGSVRHIAVAAAIGLAGLTQVLHAYVLLVTPLEWPARLVVLGEFALAAWWLRRIVRAPRTATHRDDET